uniref:Golgi apparatus protein 1 n=1 Tax=Mesocestoides corti TaxID=53468 RepID=A0A5K3EYH0_MESCO
MVDPLLVNCLWSHRHPPRSGGKAVGTLSGPCLREITNLMLVRASSIDLNPEVFQSCLADLGRFCSPRRPSVDEEDEDEDDEMEQGMSCLEDYMDQLQPVCREALVRYTQDVEEKPDLDRRIARSCLAAERRFCEGVPHSVQRVISESATADEELTLHDLMFECLVEHKNHADMELECKAAIEHFQILSLKDVRISRSFHEDCHDSIVRFCPAVTAEGAPPAVMTKMAAVMCLSRSLLEQKLLALPNETHSIPEACARHIRFELLSRSESLVLDLTLAVACEADRKLYCSHAPKGLGEALECLRDHRSRLSPECHREVFSRDQLAMAESRSDFKLMTTCAEMIHSHCENFKHNFLLLECLKKTSDGLGDLFDADCRHLVIERLQTQRLDHRLSPRLNSNCRIDIRMFCAEELRADNAKPFENGNAVARCLQRQYAVRPSNEGKSLLSPSCAKYMRELLISANLNHHMDPLLAEVCHGDLSEHCSEDLALSAVDGEKSQGTVIECLRRQVAQNKVKNDSCVVEVLRLALASKADIDVDPVLARDCAASLEAICGSTAQGSGRQMKCLLKALDAKNPAMEEACRRSLEVRRELWEMSAKRPDLLDWRTLVKEINASQSRNLIIGILLTIVGAVFVVGLCCGRRTRCVARSTKNR